MKRFLLPLPFFIMSCATDKLEQPITLDELMIESHSQSREIGYTNKQAGFFYTETNGEHRSSWQGWHIMSTKMMDDYAISVEGKELKKSDAQLAMVFPHQIRRGYKVGVQESVTLLDSIDALVIELDKIKGHSLQVLPLFSDSPDSSDYIVEWKDEVLLIAKKRHLQRTVERNYPVWVGIKVVSQQSNISPSFTPLLNGMRLAPASVQVSLGDSRKAIVMVAGNTKEQTVELAKDISTRFPNLIAARKARMEQLLNRAFVRTNDARFNKALHWAMLSMDALIMNQLHKGIFAGLPWFSNYWGRDSFISLPGATLVSGNFGEAKEILRSFARWQETNPTNPNFGRIPNIVTPTSIGYNTADGTPWFVSALYDYIRFTNDTAFVVEMYPVVKRSIEGALKYKVEKNYFLTHEEAETWMDAVGPDGPWSPRGNRANDIQALWYNQLLVGSRLATFMGDSTSAQRWSDLSQKVALNFDTYFVDHERGFVYDHLNADGSRDQQFRPNQLFTTNILLNPLHRFTMFRLVSEKLVYEHGVASLSQEDNNFHPYHEHPPYYPKDAAYHNGIVWTWLAGPWIDLATRYDVPNLAYKVTDNMIGQILDRGAVGTISELLDAAPRPKEQEPRLSGTFTQAWSLAEFIRNFYQSYLGVQIDASGPSITLTPKLPATFTEIRFRSAIDDYYLNLTYRVLKNKGEFIVESLSHSKTKSTVLRVEWRLQGDVRQDFEAEIAPGTNVKFIIESHRVQKEVNGNLEPVRSTRTFVPEGHAFGVKLATPTIQPNLRSLQGPGHPLLSSQQIKSSNPLATVLLDLEDPEFDDKGPGTYVYPTTPYLKPGSLDITRFAVSSDEANTYFRMRFRNLSNPGWHPQYGFQLTYVAIAIDKDGKPGRAQKVGRNANISLPDGLGYETIIYVGGGMRVESQDGSVLGEYIPIPGDEKNPLGNHFTKTVSFSLPNTLIGTPQPNWRFFVYVGAQDDHGGAGLGDFRAVEATAGEWVGGGKKRKSDSNVYDQLFTQPTGRTK